jgi:signal transduction histidine kinase
VGTKLVAPSQDAEIKDLVTTLNDFLTRMEEASAEKGRFYAAASHELRNPLQALAGHLELALSQPRSNGEYEETVQEALVQTQRLTSMMESVLLLHQLQGRMAAGKLAVPVGPVVQEVIGSLGPLIETRELEMSLSLEPGVCVQSVPMHAHVIVRNLIENAVKYAREGGCIRVNLSSTQLKIENELSEGVALAADRLFEPFYRQQASRSTKSGGNGLGLAICLAVAKTNGWTLELGQIGQFVVADLHFGE